MPQKLHAKQKSFATMNNHFETAMKDVDTLYDKFEHGAEAKNTLNGIAEFWKMMAGEIKNSFETSQDILPSTLVNWKLTLQSKQNDLYKNRNNIVRSGNDNTKKMFDKMSSLLNFMNTRIWEYQQHGGNVQAVETGKLANEEKYAKEVEEEKNAEKKNEENLIKNEEIKKHEENLIKEDKKDVEEKKDDEKLIKNDENLIKNEEIKKDEENLIKDEEIKQDDEKPIKDEEIKKNEENLIKNVEDKKDEEILIKNEEIKKDEEIDKIEPLKPEEENKIILNADAGDQKTANEKAAGAKKMPNKAQTVKDLRRLEKALAATNESLLTKQSNQFAAFCNCLRVLNRTLAKSGGKVTPENAEKIGKAYVALTYARHKYYVHCEKHPKTNKVRVDRVRLVDQTMKKLGDLKGLNPDICKAENAVLANENNQLAKMETTYNATAAHGEYIRSMEAIQSML